LIEADGATTTAPAAEPSAPRGTLSPTGRLGLSVTPLTPALAEEAQLQGPVSGLVVEDVQRSSAAARAQIVPGHRIVAVDGTAVSAVQELDRLLQAKQPGEVVGLTLRNRDGSRLVATVRIPGAVGNGR